MNITEARDGTRGTLTTRAEPHTKIHGTIVGGRFIGGTFNFKIDGVSSSNNFITSEWDFEADRPTFQEQFDKLPVGTIFSIPSGSWPHRQYVKLNAERFARLNAPASGTTYPAMGARHFQDTHDIEVIR